MFSSIPVRRKLTQLREAIGRGDASAISRLAHALAGAVGIFGAKPALEAARRLETIARQGRLSEAEEAWQQLDKAFTRLKPRSAR